MKSRWFHSPTLHTASASAPRKVGWLELFYDLIFVAAIIQLGDSLSEGGSIGDFGRFALHFAPLWMAWVGFSFYANRFQVDDVLHRVLVFLNMFTVGAMAISSRAAFAGQPAAFAGAYALSCGTLGLLYLRAYRQVPEARDYSAYWGGIFVASGALFALSIFLPVPWGYPLWALGAGVIFLSPLSRPAVQLAERYPVDLEHLAERFGLLIIIVLGESFVKVLSFLTSSGLGADLSYQVKGFFNLGMTCALWWIYFDDIAGSELRKGRIAFMAWLFGHLPLALGITAVGVAVKKAIKLGLNDVPPDGVRWGLAGALALVFVSVAAIDAVTERHNVQVNEGVRITSRLASAVLLLLLAVIGASMTGGVFLGLVTAICVGQVIFDLMMAPTQHAEAPQDAVLTSDLARRAQAGGEGPAPRPRSSRDVVRIGAPAEMRRDLYFFFLEGSWLRLFASFVFAYIAINVLFAGLFLLEPEGIGGTEQPNFVSAFFLSVQTFGTIGYGVLHPRTDFTNLVVTIEAAVGMIFAALATGTVLAKAARPRAAVLFSKVGVIHPFNGVPTLMIRVANARGNDVSEATASMSVVMDTISAEGHHLRRVHDMRLLRERQPVFGLTWTIMHPIDAQSPLHGMDLTHAPQISTLVVTLTGHDSTYGQTIHARNMYTVHDLRVGHRFVDVFSQTPDGRMLIDLLRFHDTTPV